MRLQTNNGQNSKQTASGRPHAGETQSTRTSGLAASWIVGRATLKFVICSSTGVAPEWSHTRAAATNNSVHLNFTQKNHHHQIYFILTVITFSTLV